MAILLHIPSYCVSSLFVAIIPSLSSSINQVQDIAMSVLLKSIQKSYRVIQILLSTESESYRRLAGAIPSSTIEAHTQRVEEELHQLPANTTTAQMR